MPTTARSADNSRPGPTSIPRYFTLGLAEEHTGMSRNEFTELKKIAYPCRKILSSPFPCDLPELLGRYISSI